MNDLRPYVNSIRLSKVTSPVPGSYPVGSGDLSVDIDFSIKMHVPQGDPVTSGWAFDPINNNKVKVLVFQVTSRDDHNFLTTMNFRNPQKLQNLLWNSYKSNKFAYKIISWEGISDQDMSLLSNARQIPGGIEYDIPFRLSDNGDEFIINSGRPHLSYFLLPFYDTAATSGGAQITSTPTFSDIEIKEVIYNDQITKSGLVFSLPTGESWRGNVQLSSTGHFMTHNPQQNEMHLLNAALTRNTILQDFRVFQQFREQINTIDFAVNEGEDTTKRTYISDFLISRDGNKRNRFFFSVNILKAVKDGSSFAALFANQTAKDALQPLIKIKDLKVYRDSLQIKQKELIVQSSDAITPGLLEESTYVFEDDLGESVTFGAIKEISSVNRAEGLRHFTGTDYEIANYSSGHFIYTIEIEVTDPTVEYMKSRKQELLEAQATLEAYYSYFKTNSRSKVKNQYGSAAQKELLMKSISSFLSFISFAAGTQNSALQALDIYDIIGPYTGTEKGIELFLAEFSILLMKVESIIGASTSGSTNKATSNGQQQTNNSASPAPRIINIVLGQEEAEKHHFDATANKTFGYEFIEEEDADNSDGVGLMTIDFNYYLNRTAQEKNKYFNIQGTKVGTFTHPNGGLIDLNLTTDMQYLTPLKIKLGPPHPALGYAFDSTKGGSIYNQTLTEVIKYNLGAPFEKGSSADRLNSMLSLAGTLGIALPEQMVGAATARIKAPEEKGEDIIDKSPGEGKPPWNQQQEQIKAQQQQEKQQQGKDKEKQIESYLATIFSIISMDVMNDTYKNVNLNNYNLGDRNNNFEGFKQMQYDMLATQTKALITYASFQMDPMSAKLAYLYKMNSGDFGWFYEYFLNLVKVDILTNYSIDNVAAASGPNVKNPTFLPMSTNAFTAATTSPDNKILCRLTKYQCVKENMLNESIVSFPVLNQYFLIDAYQLAQVPATGQTSIGAGHQHTYQVDANGNGVAATAFHPQTNKIYHEHEIVNYAIQPAQSACYPNCEDMHGYAGASMHTHEISSGASIPQVEDINYAGMEYTEIDNQIINTGGAYRVLKRAPGAIETNISSATNTMFINQISDAVWEDIN